MQKFESIHLFSVRQTPDSFEDIGSKKIDFGHLTPQYRVSVAFIFVGVEPGKH